MFGRGPVVAPTVESAVVIPVDPFEGGVFHGVEAGPGPLGPDQLLLVEPVHGLGGGVVVRVADGADGGLDAGRGEAFGVGDGQVLLRFKGSMQHRLVELMLHLAGTAVRTAIVAQLGSLPAQLRRSLTWDQGTEMAQHVQLRIESGIEVYFCEPHSPWQRGTNENTNGLLRQYFPKGTDLARWSVEDLAAVAAILNDRPVALLVEATIRCE